jgi:cell wall-associated NlpC family hydrolase
VTIACACTPVATAASTSASKRSQSIASGGQAYGEPNPATVQRVSGARAKMLPSGLAAAPESAPAEVKQMISAANEIIGKPYQYGGGHDMDWGAKDRGYDCSGTVSYALHGAGDDVLDAPLDSGSFMKWGEPGQGDWVTVYTNPGHAFVVIAGLRLDTSASGDPSGNKGPRWRPALRSTRGFRARHPEGL